MTKMCCGDRRCRRRRLEPSSVIDSLLIDHVTLCDKSQDVRLRLDRTSRIFQMYGDIRSMPFSGISAAAVCHRAIFPPSSSGSHIWSLRQSSRFCLGEICLRPLCHVPLSSGLPRSRLPNVQGRCIQAGRIGQSISIHGFGIHKAAEPAVGDFCNTWLKHWWLAAWLDGP